MKLYSLLTFIFVVGTPSAFAGELEFSFTPNEGQRSFQMEISNSGAEGLQCKVEIIAEIGTKDCEKIVDTYKYTSSRVHVKGNSKVTNPTFGIDRLASINRRNKTSTRVFCGEPQVKSNCQ